MPSAFPSIDTALPAPLSALTGQGRQTFLQSLSQHARLISIDTPLEAGALLVQRFSGEELMSGLFRFDVDCIATSAHYELKALLGEEVSLRVLQADGGTRSFHGIVSEAMQLGGDGGIASYRLTLVPWLHALTLRRDSYVFQDKSVADILQEIFGDYPNASFRFDLKTALPQRSLTMQHRESDYDFIARLLAEEGLSFFFEHLDDRAGAGAAGDAEVKQGQARHRLVIFDHNEALARCSQPAIRFHRAHATEASDSVTMFTQRREVRPNRVALASWDYKSLTAPAAENAVNDGFGDAPPLEVYEGAGAYRYTDNAESERIAQARTESLQMAHQRMHGESAARQLAVGTWFTLTDHDAAAGDYIVLSISHRGANNLTGGTDGNDMHTEPGTYRNQFSCVARAAPVRPEYWFPKPIAPGSQVALVVGLGNEEITTERDHRIKIQFPWQRGQQPAGGQRTHPSIPNAPGKETAGTWVRVAEPAAGANWGAAFIPRIGQEVLVDFIGGDIDRPVVTGQLYNGADLPPFHGADNHPGALAGIKSKEYAGGGFNQWVIDDTPGQLRQQLYSTHAATQLNIGYLIRQNGNVRGAFRGTGFELATDAWSTLRAKRGIFISTSQRREGVSTQLDTEEAQQKIKAGAELAKALSDAAQQHQALPLTTEEGLRQLGKNTSGKDSADGQEAPKFDTPVTLIDSQAAVNITTPASSVMFAGQDLTMTSSTSMRVTAGQAVTIGVANTASLFTHSGGAKVIAAKEPVSVRAHTGPMDVLAEQAITVTSSNASIKMQAKQEILLTSGGGYIRLKGGDIEIHCPGTVSVKGASHQVLGPASLPAELKRMPDSRMHPFNEHFYLVDEVTGEKLSDIPYRIHRPSTDENWIAITSIDGKTEVAGTEEQADDLQLYYAGDDEVNHGR